MSSPCSFIFMQIKVIFITMVSHLDSLWHRGTRELGNGLLCPWKDKKKWTDATQELEFIITPLTTYRHEKNITVRLFSILLQVIAFESNPFLWDVTSENVTSDKWELCSFFSAWEALWTVYSTEETEKARNRWHIFREMEQQFWKYPLPQDNYSIWWSSCYHWHCTCREHCFGYFY